MWNVVDRRRFPRANYPCVIKIVRKKPYFSISTHTENIGSGGICVILENDLGRFTPVELELTLPNGLEPVRCGGQAVWVVKGRYPGERPPKRYDTGIEFVDLKEDDRKRIGCIIENIFKERRPSTDDPLSEK